VVIDENPSPQEFWMAMIRYCSLNAKDVDKAEFNSCYDRFIQKSVGAFSIHSCFFLGDIFDSLFKKWRRKLFGYQYDDQSRTHGYYYYNNNNNNKHPKDNTRL
jgi:hypothetical protein